MEDKKLTGSRGNRQDDGVIHEQWVPEEERERWREVVVPDQRPHGEEAREEVDTEHHLVLGHLVLLEQRGPARRGTGRQIATPVWVR